MEKTDSPVLNFVNLLLKFACLVLAKDCQILKAVHSAFIFSVQDLNHNVC